MSSYRESRQRILLAMAEVKDAIDAAPREARPRLEAVASDDLFDALNSGWNPAELKDAVTDAARRFWLRENEIQSVRVPPRTDLRLVTETEFAEMSYGPKEAS